jgi:hypothetical protein
VTYAPDYPPEEFLTEPLPGDYDYEPPFEMDSSEPPEDVRFLDEPPEEYDYEPEPFLSTPAPGQAALPGFEPPPAEPPQEWSWVDARFAGLEQHDPEGNLVGYEVGCVDLYANRMTGDLGGMFLRVQAFEPGELDQAEDLFNRLNGYAYDKNLAAYDLPDLAEKAANKIAVRENLAPPEWRGLTSEEYALFEREFGLVEDVDADMPPEQAQADLLRTAYELGGVEVEIQTEELHPAVRALTGIGLSAEDFDPDRDVPPFYDELTQTAYWIGIYQPDPDDRETCVASILSLTRDPDTGDYEAQLAPCVAGDWDKAYQSSEHLIGIAQRSDDIERVFEAAEGMAIAADQRETWQQERGVRLEPGSARDIAEYTVQTWEVDL